MLGQHSIALPTRMFRQRHDSHTVLPGRRAAAFLVYLQQHELREARVALRLSLACDRVPHMK